MEVRVLKYFLAVAREENISRAAEFLHLSQPTLSRQLRDLEDELGKTLFLRGKRRITLTDDGILLRRRAEEIVGLIQKTERELLLADDNLSGDIYIGAGESDGMRVILHTMHKMQQRYPLMHFHILSGDAVDLAERLDRGLDDFAVMMGDVDAGKYNFLRLPVVDTWGVLMRKDDPLAVKSAVTVEDLQGKPMIVPRRVVQSALLKDQIGAQLRSLNICCTHNLTFNAALMADEGIGYVLNLDKIYNTEGTNLCFRPLKPRLEQGMFFAWKKYPVFTKGAEKFLEQLREDLMAGRTSED